MLRLRMRRGFLLVVVWMTCIGLPFAVAVAGPPGEPPVRVARVAYLTGAASLMPAGSEVWQAVDINRPLVRGDRLATAAGTRVELQLGDAVAHLAGDTDMRLLTLDRWRAQMALTRGTAELDVRTLPDGQTIEIDTPQVAVVIDRSARVRVDLGHGDASTVTVRRGTVVVHGSDGARKTLHAGERYRFAGSALADAVTLAVGSGDAFDRWCRSREQWYADAGPRQYVPAGTLGYQDLDHYGQWSRQAGYGEIWFPDDVAADWVPYRQGHWTWIVPWGWTWMSHEPWGFAPFHYGRWALIDGRWGWLPGPVGARAVYAPALVGFFGGDGWRISIGVNVRVAPVGWYPLAPGMIYNPWYAANWRYYERVNRFNVRFRHDHRHRRVKQAYNVWRQPQRLRHVHYLGQAPHGITVVSRQTMAGGHEEAGARLHLAGGHVRKAPVRDHGLHVVPHAGHATSWHPVLFKGATKPVTASHVSASAPVASRRWHAHPTRRMLPRVRRLHPQASPSPRSLPSVSRLHATHHASTSPARPQLFRPSQPRPARRHVSRSIGLPRHHSRVQPPRVHRAVKFHPTVHRSASDSHERKRHDRPPPIRIESH